MSRSTGLHPSHPRPFDLVMVEWVDSEKEEDWTDYYSFKSNDPPLMLSVGFLYEETESRIVIYQTVDKSILDGGIGLFESIFTIPKCSVKNIVIIRRLSKHTTHGPKYLKK